MLLFASAGGYVPARLHSGDVPDQSFKEPLGVGVGAGLGALARFAITAAVPAAGLVGAFGIPLVINIIGCFAMGMMKPSAFLGVGFLGGFTTFSALAVTATQSSALTAAAFMVVSFIACVGAWLLGDRVRPA